MARDRYWLTKISSQEVLILLRSSFSVPKVIYLLGWSPFGLPQEKFDAMLKYAIQHITNSKLSHCQWLQASLPVRDGGLGIRRVSVLVIPAFVVSAARTFLSRTTFFRSVSQIRQ